MNSGTIALTDLEDPGDSYVIFSKNRTVDNKKQIAKLLEMTTFVPKISDIDYFHDAFPGYEVIDLPFRWSQMSMIFVLPLRADTKEVSSTEIISALGDLRIT